MKSVAIIGASADKSKFGNKAIRAYKKAGWQVYAVNPRWDKVEGIKAYKNILDITEPIDRVSIYLPPVIGMTIIQDVAQKKPKEVFLNPGSESDALIRQAKDFGLNLKLACSILDIGENPVDY